MKIKRGDGLNVVPFIDVMLVLLALVLSISTFVAQGKIKVEVPSASQSQQEKKEDEKPISIVVTNDDKIYVDDTEMDDDKLKEYISKIPNDKMVNFKGDKSSTLDKFVFVINELTKKGHESDKFRIDAKRD